MSVWNDDDRVHVESDEPPQDVMSVSGISRLAVGSTHPSWLVGGEPTEGGLREPSAVLSPYGLSRKEFEKISVPDLTNLDHSTKTRLIRLANVLPIAAFHAVRELQDEYKPLAPARYAVAVLNRWHREGRYA